MTALQKFHPNKKVFIFRPVVISSIAAFFFAVVGTVGLIVAEAEFLIQAVPVLVSLALVVFTYFDRQVAFDKTSYEIHHDRILHKTGGLLSDNTTNLPFRNITQIEMKLPFLENRFYSTGHLAVHAAGSASGKVSFVSVDEPEALFEALEESLRRNGFSIGRNEMVQQEEPGIIGVFLDGTMGGALGGVFFVLFIAGTLIPVVAELESTAVLLGSIGFLLIIGAAVLAASVVSFIDRKQRTYTLWDDCIEYHDGFLTRRAKLIPFANLADTHAEEPFLKRIFGMADVVISCQGSSGNIQFPSMPRATQFRANLDRLINSAEPIEPVAPPSSDTSPGTTSTPGAPTTESVAEPAYVPPSLGATSGSSKTYRLSILSHAARSIAFLPLLFFIPIIFSTVGVLLGVETLLPAIFGSFFLVLFGAMAVTIPIIGYSLFEKMTQKFILGPNSVSWSQEFISQKNTIEFTNDKVTAVTVHRTYFDRLFKTVSITFYSIGADQPLKFKCLPDHEAVLRELHLRFGLPDEEPREELATNVQLNAVLAADIPTFIFLGLALLAATIAVVVLELPLTLLGIALFVCSLCAAAVVVQPMVYHPRSRLQFFDHHLMIRKGLIDHNFTYVAYHDARNVVSTLYPYQTTGSVVIDAGGAGAKVKIEHMDAPHQLHDRLDAILYQRPMRDVAQTDTFDADVLGHWQPDAKNEHIKSTLILVSMMGVTIPLIPLAWLYNRAYFKVADFSLQTDRIVQRTGVFFKKQNTVLINRIDQLQTRRGALHNLCKNGVVEVYTVGSGHAELTLGPHPDFQQVYEAIDQRAA